MLVASRDGLQTDALGVPKLGRFLRTDIGFVAKRGEVGMFCEHLEAHFQVSRVSGCQFKIEDDTTKGNEQMQFIAEIVSFFDVTLPKRAPKAAQSPVEPGAK